MHLHRKGKQNRDLWTEEERGTGTEEGKERIGKWREHRERQLRIKGHLSAGMKT